MLTPDRCITMQSMASKVPVPHYGVVLTHVETGVQSRRID